VNPLFNVDVLAPECSTTSTAPGVADAGASNVIDLLFVATVKVDVEFAPKLTDVTESRCWPWMVTGVGTSNAPKAGTTVSMLPVVVAAAEPADATSAVETRAAVITPCPTSRGRRFNRLGLARTATPPRLNFPGNENWFVSLTFRCCK
jgi:hypothetical protein